MSRYNTNVNVSEETLLQASQLEINIPAVEGTYELAYGYDSSMGYFYQFFDENEELLIDEDGLFTGLSGANLGSLLSLFSLNKSHADKCFLDLPF